MAPDPKVKKPVMGFYSLQKRFDSKTFFFCHALLVSNAQGPGHSGMETWNFRIFIQPKIKRWWQETYESIFKITGRGFTPFWFSVPAFTFTLQSLIPSSLNSLLNNKKLQISFLVFSSLLILLELYTWSVEIWTNKQFFLQIKI